MSTAREIIARAVDPAAWDDIWAGDPVEWMADRQTRALADADAALSALAAAGLQVVPVEPTEEMTRAATWSLDRARERDGKLQDPRPYTAAEKHAIRYRAMLSAAAPPALPKQGEG